MKDKVLKLCRRLRKAIKSDLLQILEIEPYKSQVFKCLQDANFFS